MKKPYSRAFVDEAIIDLVFWDAVGDPTGYVAFIVCAVA